MPDFLIRPATSQDGPLILALLREFAEYEKLTDIFRTSEAVIARDFFGTQPVVHCDLAFAGGEAVGLVTFFWTYGSFSAKRGLFVEDLFVRPGFRGRGHGKALLKHLAGKGADRLEWRVLDWNRPAQDFYRSIGARPLEDWYTYVLETEAMKKAGRIMSVTLVVAAADNGVIGRHGAIPWRISEDLKRFKALTMGHRVVMGRKTWESLPKKPLPGRDNVVLTRSSAWRGDGAIAMQDLKTALAGGAMVIGGADIYHAALPFADTIELTEVHRAFEGDAVFDFDRSVWDEVAREQHTTPDGLAYSYVTLRRI